MVKNYHRNIMTILYCGELKDYRECHIKFNWLLVYRIYKDELILSLIHTGTHAKVLNL